jgi:hypothetical protein
VWEVTPGEVVVEMPPSPPVVKRNRKGASHINGIDSTVLSVVDTTTLELSKPELFPDDGGKFFFIPVNEIQTTVEGDVSTYNFNNKLSSCMPIYEYTSRVGNQLLGITPDLPKTADTNTFTLVSANRDDSNIITATTATDHNFEVGEYAIIEDAVLVDPPTPLFTADYSSDVLSATPAGTTFTEAGGIFLNASGGQGVFSGDGTGATYYDLATPIDVSTKGSVHIKGTLNGGSGYLFSGYSTSGVGTVALDIQMITGNGLYAYIYGEGGYPFGGSGIFVPAASLSPTGTYEIAVEWDFSLPTNNLKMYIDGVLEAQNTVSVSQPRVSSWDRVGPSFSFGTASKHGFSSVDVIKIYSEPMGGVFLEDAASGPDVNGVWEITEVVSPTEFKCYSFAGSSGERESNGGTARVERIGAAADAGRVILRSAQLDERLTGPYLWDQGADFVLSSLTTKLTTEVEAGSTQRAVQVEPNDIPSEEGRLIFDFGTENQEGPVRYFFKPNDTSISIDPSYVFQKEHEVGSSVAMIRRRGGIQFDGYGSEKSPYITDPAAARLVLVDLAEELKSVGIFINFLVRYPELYYATIDVYKSGNDPG